MHDTDSTQLFRSAVAVTFAVGEDMQLLYSRLNRTSILLSRASAGFLLSCKSFATIEQHAERIRQALRGNSETVDRLKALLLKAIQSGMMVSASDISAHLSFLDSSSSSSGSITAIALPTRNRPKTLERAIRSYVENIREYGRSPRFVVADDSESRLVQSQNRTILGVLKRCYGAKISYAGIDERAAFVEKLARETDVPAAILRFAIMNSPGFLPSHGACRNSLLLDTIGELVLQTDDDTICKIGDPPQSSTKLAFTALPDPTQFWFFPDYESALNSVEFASRDFLGLHEQMLGKSLADCSSSFSVKDWDIDAIDVDFICGMKGRDGHVRATFAGIVGDSGIGKSCFYLFCEEPSIKRLTVSEELYRAAMMSGQVLRTVTKPTVSVGGHCAGANVGLDNRTLLPPFMPVQRGEDTVFGKLLWGSFWTDYVGFIPSVIVHHSPNIRSLSSPLLWNELTALMTNDIIGTVISLFYTQSLRGYPGGGSGLEALGIYLTELGQMAPQDFQEVIRIALWQSIAPRLIRLEKHREKHAHKASYWAKDLERCLNAQRLALAEESFGTPVDLIPQDGTTGVPSLQRLVLALGELLRYWPRIVEAAAHLSRRGEKLAQPI